MKNKDDRRFKIVLEKSYRRDEDVASREIADEVILVPVKKRLADARLIFLLQEETAVRIWNLCDGHKTVKEILETLGSEFDVDSDDLRLCSGPGRTGGRDDSIGGDGHTGAVESAR